TLTAVRPGCRTHAVWMAVPATGAVLLLTAVFAVRGIVIVELVRFTVSDSGKLALMVTVPVLEFTWATAGVVASASAIARNASVARTLIELLMSFSSAIVRILYCE